MCTCIFVFTELGHISREITWWKLIISLLWIVVLAVSNLFVFIPQNKRWLYQRTLLNNNSFFLFLRHWLLWFNVRQINFTLWCKLFVVRVYVSTRWRQHIWWCHHACWISREDSLPYLIMITEMLDIQMRISLQTLLVEIEILWRCLSWIKRTLRVTIIICIAFYCLPHT